MKIVVLSILLSLVVIITVADVDQSWINNLCEESCNECVPTEPPSTTTTTTITTTTTPQSTTTTALFPSTSTSTTTTTPTTTTSSSCVDKFDDCQRYSSAKRMYCNDLTYAGQPWMVENCAKFCGICSELGPVTTLPPCIDLFENCEQYSNAKDAYCNDTSYAGQAWMTKYCAKFCGVCSEYTSPPINLPTATPDEVLCPNP